MPDFGLTEQPYFSRTGGELILAEEWNKIQQFLRAEIARHSHSGQVLDDPDLGTPRKDGTMLSGSALVNLAVTTAKIANQAITTDKLANGSVTPEKLSEDARRSGFGGLPDAIAQLAELISTPNDQERRSAMKEAPVRLDGSVLTATVGTLLDIGRIVFGYWLEYFDVGEVSIRGRTSVLGDSAGLNLQALVGGEGYPALFHRFRDRAEGARQIAEDKMLLAVVLTAVEVLANHDVAVGTLTSFVDDYGQEDSWNGIAARKTFLDSIYRPLVEQENAAVLDGPALKRLTDLLLEFLAALWKRVAEGYFIASPPGLDIPDEVRQSLDNLINNAGRAVSRAMNGHGLVRELSVGLDEPMSILDIYLHDLEPDDPEASGDSTWIVCEGSVRRISHGALEVGNEGVWSSLQSDGVCPPPNFILRPEVGATFLAAKPVGSHLLVVQRAAGEVPAAGVPLAARPLVATTPPIIGGSGTRPPSTTTTPTGGGTEVAAPPGTAPIDSPGTASAFDAAEGSEEPVEVYRIFIRQLDDAPNTDIRIDELGANNVSSTSWDTDSSVRFVGEAYAPVPVVVQTGQGVGFPRFELFNHATLTALPLPVENAVWPYQGNLEIRGAFSVTTSQTDDALALVVGVPATGETRLLLGKTGVAPWWSFDPAENEITWVGQVRLSGELTVLGASHGIGVLSALAEDSWSPLPFASLDPESWPENGSPAYSDAFSAMIDGTPMVRPVFLAQSIHEEDLVAHWPLDSTVDSNGDGVYDLAPDHGKGGHHAAPGTPLVISVVGVEDDGGPSGAYSFPGGIGSWVTLLSAEKADELLADDHTIALWFKGSGSGTDRATRIITRDIGAYFALTLEPPDPEGYQIVSFVPAGRPTIVTALAQTGIWHCAVMVFAQGTATVWIDGVRAGGTPYPAAGASRPLVLGSATNENPQNVAQFQGQIADVRLIAGVPNDDEIRKLSLVRPAARATSPRLAVDDDKVLILGKSEEGGLSVELYSIDGSTLLHDIVIERANRIWSSSDGWVYLASGNEVYGLSFDTFADLAEAPPPVVTVEGKVVDLFAVADRLFVLEMIKLPLGGTGGRTENSTLYVFERAADGVHSEITHYDYSANLSFGQFVAVSGGVVAIANADQLQLLGLSDDGMLGPLDIRHLSGRILSCAGAEGRFVVVTDDGSVVTVPIDRGSPMSRGHCITSTARIVVQDDIAYVLSDKSVHVIDLVDPSASMIDLKLPFVDDLSLFDGEIYALHAGSTIVEKLNPCPMWPAPQRRWEETPKLREGRVLDVAGTRLSTDAGGIDLLSVCVDNPSWMELYEATDGDVPREPYTIVHLGALQHAEQGEILAKGPMIMCAKAQEGRIEYGIVNTSAEDQ